MAAQRQTNDDIPGRDGAGTALRRRGLIAGAAAIAAGLALGRTAQPVAAVTGGANGTALILGANNSTGNTPNTQTQPTMLVNAASYTYGASSETLIIITDKGAPALAIGSQKPGGGGQGIYSFSLSGNAIQGNVAQSGASSGGSAVRAYSSDPQGFGVVAYANGTARPASTAPGTSTVSTASRRRMAVSVSPASARAASASSAPSPMATPSSVKPSPATGSTASPSRTTPLSARPLAPSSAASSASPPSPIPSASTARRWVWRARTRATWTATSW